MSQRSFYDLQGEKPEWLPDISSIEFPTDRITVGQMRRDQPELLDADRPFVRAHLESPDALYATRMEHVLARKAWAAAIGLPDPAPERERLEEIGQINKVYTRFGISTGRQQTLELVRRFEAEAAQLAKLSVGHGRG